MSLLACVHVCRDYLWKEHRQTHTHIPMSSLTIRFFLLPFCLHFIWTGRESPLLISRGSLQTKLYIALKKALLFHCFHHLHVISVIYEKITLILSLSHSCLSFPSSTPFFPPQTINPYDWSDMAPTHRENSTPLCIPYHQKFTRLKNGWKTWEQEWQALPPWQSLLFLLLFVIPLTIPHHH